MRKLLCALLALLIMSGAALSEISIEENEFEAAGRLAAAEFAADCAFYCASSGDIYYIKNDAVYMKDARNGVTAKLAELAGGSAYTGIAADVNGTVYIMKTEADETAKSAIICLSDVNGRYYAFDYPYPGASGCLSTGEVLMCDASMTGCAFTELRCSGESIRLMSALGVFWSSLTGYDEFVLIDPAACIVCTVPAESCFDPYGEPDSACAELVQKLGNGSLVSPDRASLSADGSMLLVTAGGRAYLIDTVTLDISAVDADDGSLKWDGNSLVLETADGESCILNSGFAVSGWGEAEFGSSGDFESDWGASSLDDWS